MLLFGCDEVPAAATEAEDDDELTWKMMVSPDLIPTLDMDLSLSLMS